MKTTVRGFAMGIMALILLLMHTQSYGESGKAAIERMLPGWANAYVWVDVTEVEAWEMLPNCSSCGKVWEAITDMFRYFGISLERDNAVYGYGGAPFHALRMVDRWVGFLHMTYDAPTIRRDLNSKSDIQWNSFQVQGRTVPQGHRTYGEIAFLPNILMISHAFGTGVWGINGRTLAPDPDQYPDMAAILAGREGRMIDNPVMQQGIALAGDDKTLVLVVDFSDQLFQEIEELFRMYPFAQGLINIMHPIDGIAGSLKVHRHGMDMHAQFMCETARAAEQLVQVVDTVKSAVGVFAMARERRAMRLRRYLSHFSIVQKDTLVEMKLNFDPSSFHLVSDIIDYADSYSTR
jgi:hypothetical protein